MATTFGKFEYDIDSVVILFGLTVPDVILITLWLFIEMGLYGLLRKIRKPLGKTKTFDQCCISLLNSLIIVALGYDIVIFHDYNFLDPNSEQEVTKRESEIYIRINRHHITIIFASDI